MSLRQQNQSPSPKVGEIWKIELQGCITIWEIINLTQPHPLAKCLLTTVDEQIKPGEEAGINIFTNPEGWSIIIEEELDRIKAELL